MSLRWKSGIRETSDIFWTRLNSSLIQVSLSTAHPAKFSEAVATALRSSAAFDFDRDVLPEEFRGLLQKRQRVIDVESADVDLVKSVIESTVDMEQTKSSTGCV
jgi:threonine synthase